jgi:hypothetical protein
MKISAKAPSSPKNKPFSLVEEKAASDRRRAKLSHDPSHEASLRRLATVFATEAKTACDDRSEQLQEEELQHWPNAISYFSNLVGKRLTLDGVRLIMEESMAAGVEAATCGPLLSTRCEG